MMSSNDARAAPWLKPAHVTGSAQTAFAKPIAKNPESPDFAHPVPMSPVAARGVAADDGAEVRKKCNFVFLPGVLFNRQIGRKVK